MRQQYNLNNNTIEKILKKHNLENLKFVIPIKTGLINPVFLINNQYVLRIDKSEHLKNVQGHNTRFEREAFLYNLLPKKGIPTPQCLGLDSSREIIPEKYIIISYIAGISPSKGFKNLDKETQPRLSFQMGDIIRKIHSIAPNDLKGSELFGLKDDWKKLYDKEFTYLLEEAIKGKYFIPKTEEQIKKIYYEFQNQVSDLDNHLRLVHGDFSPSNIQINNNKIVGIFDFEWSNIGDPLWDLQKLTINFQLGDRFCRNSFLEGYGIVNPTKEELIRIKMYTMHQGLWGIWATKTQLFPFGEKEIKEGNQLINSAISFNKN